MTLIRAHAPISILPAVLLILGIASAPAAQAQSGISAEVEAFPHSSLADPGAPGEEELEIQIEHLRFSLGAPALVFGEGRTSLQSSFAYNRLRFDYRNWDGDEGDTQIDEVHGLEYTATVMHALGERWSGLLMITPGLYSDFEGDLTGDDFNVSGAVAAIKRHSETLSYGFGAAYTLRFGEPFPVPLVAVNWTPSRRTRLDLLLPAYAEFWYAPRSWVEFGLAARASGGQYHGDPDSFDPDNPQLLYSSATAGPSVVFHLGEIVHLRVDAGTTLFRRFDFNDGDDELRSIDLENSGFVRLGLTVGG